MQLKFKLSLDDTFRLKGIAILMLLIHHLFSADEGADISRDGIVAGNELLLQHFATANKLCVAIFVLLSGYGVAKTYKSNWLKFYIHRFVKLYGGFWLIWLLFVPIGVFFFDRTLNEVYGNHILLYLGLDFCGLLNCIGKFGYNPTWWFMSCIILLYILTPLINKTIKYWYLWITFGVLHCYVHIPGISPMTFYLNAYILGYVLSHYEIRFDNCQSSYLYTVASILLIALLSYRFFVNWGGADL